MFTSTTPETMISLREETEFIKEFLQNVPQNSFNNLSKGINEGYWTIITQNIIGTFLNTGTILAIFKLS